MSIKFRCRECHEIIVINFLNPGEVAVCNNCNTKNIVPNESEFTEDATSVAQTDPPPVEQVKKSEEEIEFQIMLKSLRYMIIGLIFTTINFQLILGPLVFKTTIIGHITIFAAILTAFNMKKRDKFLYSILALTIVHFLSDLLALFGLGNTFSINFIFVENFLILIWLYRITKAIDFLNEYTRYIFYLLMLGLVVVIFSAMTAISTAFLIWVNQQLADLPYYLILFNLIGLGLPTVLMNFIQTVLVIYFAFSMKKKINQHIDWSAYPEPNRDYMGYHS